MFDIEGLFQDPVRPSVCYISDEWICDETSTKVTRINLDFRIAFVKLTEWDATKQMTKPLPVEALDEFCPKVNAKAKAMGSVAAFMTG